MHFLKDKDFPQSDIKQPKLNRNRKSQCICKTCKEIRNILPQNLENSCKPGCVKRISENVCASPKEDGDSLLSRNENETTSGKSELFGSTKKYNTFSYNGALLNYNKPEESKKETEVHTEASEYYKGITFNTKHETEQCSCSKRLYNPSNNFDQVNSPMGNSRECYSESQIQSNHQLNESEHFKSPHGHKIKSSILDRIEYYSNLCTNETNNPMTFSRKMHKNDYQTNRKMSLINKSAAKSSRSLENVDNAKYDDDHQSYSVKCSARCQNSKDFNDNAKEYRPKTFQTCENNEVCTFLGNALQYASSRKFSDDSFNDSKMSCISYQDKDQECFSQRLPEHTKSLIHSESFINSKDSAFNVYSEDESSAYSSLINDKPCLVRPSYKTSDFPKKSSQKNRNPIWNELGNLSIIPLLKETSSQPREALKEYIYSSNYLKNRQISYDEIYLDENILKECEDRNVCCRTSSNVKNLGKMNEVEEELGQSRSEMVYGTLNVKVTPVPSSILLKY